MGHIGKHPQAGHGSPLEVCRIGIELNCTVDKAPWAVPGPGSNKHVQTRCMWNDTTAQQPDRTSCRVLFIPSVTCWFS
eukprot:365999-Chlamydomonas_euryale.AAC.8